MSSGVAQSKRWQMCRYDRKTIVRLAHTLGLFETTACLLTRRGITTPSTAEKFLRPKVSDLYNPYLLQDMREAVTRIKQAINNKEKILVYGDYDVDGTTATVILKKALEIVGANVSYYIPERLTDGYGLRESGIDKAQLEGYKLIISVDCGIRAHAVVEYARGLNIDMIITDHHLPEGDLPLACAVINPKRLDCDYPDKNLAGCGVSLKLAQALLAEYGASDKLKSLLIIAAIGTIADIVPLIDENRIIAKCGLAEMKRANNPGLQALLHIAGIYGRDVTCYDIAYRIAPRINAAGRMGKASVAVELFSATDSPRALELARTLDEQNIARQKTEADVINEIMTQLESYLDDRVIVLAGERWHRGIIGIAASKVLEKTCRPSLVLSIEDGMSYGSGRSVKQFPLLEALDSCRELFEHYGGHSHAAGVTLPAKNIDELRIRLNKFADNLMNKDELLPAVEIDAPLSFAEINADLMREITALEPFGDANPAPVFLAENVRVVDTPLVKGRHAKMRISQGGHVFSAIWWRGASQIENFSLADTYRMVFTLTSAHSSAANIQITIREISA